MAILNTGDKLLTIILDKFSDPQFKKYKVQSPHTVTDGVFDENGELHNGWTVISHTDRAPDQYYHLIFSRAKAFGATEYSAFEVYPHSDDDDCSRIINGVYLVAKFPSPPEISFDKTHTPLAEAYYSKSRLRALEDDATVICDGLAGAFTVSKDETTSSTSLVQISEIGGYSKHYVPFYNLRTLGDVEFLKMLKKAEWHLIDLRATRQARSKLMSSDLGLKTNGKYSGLAWMHNELLTSEIVKLCALFEGEREDNSYGIERLFKLFEESSLKSKEVESVKLKFKSTSKVAALRKIRNLRSHAVSNQNKLNNSNLKIGCLSELYDLAHEIIDTFNLCSLNTSSLMTVVDEQSDNGYSFWENTIYFDRHQEKTYEVWDNGDASIGTFETIDGAEEFAKTTKGKVIKIRDFDEVILERDESGYTPKWVHVKITYRVYEGDGYLNTLKKKVEVCREILPPPRPF